MPISSRRKQLISSRRKLLKRRNQLKRRTQRNLSRGDRISELPDDVLIHIISSLDTIEAVATSVLSKRWKHVWAYVPNLDIDLSGKVEELDQNDFDLLKKLNWADQVVSSHKAPVINEFILFFDYALNENSIKKIDNWLRFAIEKRVKRLTMFFFLPTCSESPLHYTFPSIYCNSLTSLELFEVDVTGEIIENFLCNCVALEYLSVAYSKSLEELKVSGTSLNLKKLSIHDCCKKRLVISAPNLVAFSYYGEKIHVQFESTPNLIEVSIGSEYGADIGHAFSDLFSYLSQIQELRITLPHVYWNIISVPNDFVLSGLRKLDLSLQLYFKFDENLLLLRSLIKSCPVLHHLKLQLNLTPRLEYEMNETIKVEASSHDHLKTAEIVGFTGHQVHMVVASFLIESAVLLEKMIVDCRESRSKYKNIQEVKQRERKARACAKRLETNLNRSTKLKFFDSILSTFKRKSQLQFRGSSP